MLLMPLTAPAVHEIASCTAIVCARVITIETTITTTTGTTTSGAAAG